MIVVSNTTPLIGLASIRRFELLSQMFSEIVISQAVYDEVVVAGDERSGKQEVLSATWIKTVAVQDRLAVEVLLDELDLGEAETIVLARELNADWVLMDEKKGRRKLTRLGLPKIGTFGLLLKAKRVNLISSIRSDVEMLHALGFSLSSKVIHEVLAQAGESG